MLLVGVHLLLTAVAAGAFASAFGAGARAAVAHVLLVASWDFSLIALVLALPVPRRTLRVLIALTCTLQIYLYTLNVVSNESWDRNMTAHLVTAFLPTAWSGREASFPIGKPGIIAFFVAPLLTVAVVFALWGRSIDEAVGRWSGRMRGLRIAVMAIVMIALCASTIRAGVAGRDNLYWKNELVSSFFRPEGFAFEPTPRRRAVAEHDAALRAAYSTTSGARGFSRAKNVILIIVDSLRADRMQVYGYERKTTPFLSQMVASGRMKKVDWAFSTCSESFCGITSTLASREFADISAETFNIEDVLRDQGYGIHFLLSGNHRAWNGLPRFYHLNDGEMFDGSQTERYSVDDDRLVLEGLERVSPAHPARPAFFYVHLMSTHYLGVQFPESHVFTAPDDRVSPGLEPYKILEKLNKPDRYDDKVLQADGMIHRLFDALAAKHYMDDAIVVITGDHGEGLGERHWAHGWHLYNEDIHVPLLIFDPDGTYPDLTFGAQVDIGPTILNRTGLPIPDSWAGESLLHPSRYRFTHHQTYFLPNRFATIFRDGDELFKVIDTPQYGKSELYDLRADPRETHNLIATP